VIVIAFVVAAVLVTAVVGIAATGGEVAIVVVLAIGMGIGVVVGVGAGVGVGGGSEVGCVPFVLRMHVKLPNVSYLSKGGNTK